MDGCQPRALAAVTRFPETVLPRPIAGAIGDSGFSC